MTVDVARIIKEVLADMELTPREANSGNCDAVAYAIAAKLPGSVVCSVEDNYAYHFFIRYRGLYYDAEQPSGVKSAARICTQPRYIHLARKRVRRVMVWRTS